MKIQKADKPLTKSDRLKAIEIADERTERTRSDLDKNIGAETDGNAGLAENLQGDGNSVKSGDTHAPLSNGAVGDL